MTVIDEYIARGPSLVHAPQGNAFYSPATDTITLPMRAQFESAEGYYSTAFHECAHSTGHKTRLARECSVNFDHFGSEKYGREELVAEMGCAMLCAMTDVPGQFDQSAAYVASWLTAIKADSGLVVKAARLAQAAVDLILGTEHQDSTEDSSERALVAV